VGFAAAALMMASIAERGGLFDCPAKFACAAMRDGTTHKITMTTAAVAAQLRE
jgi:hypothetical protein